jgi:hypothetical protein
MRRPSHPSRDVFGLVKPAVDAHTLGLSSVAQLVEDCGFRAVIADAAVSEAAGLPERPENAAVLDQWVRKHGITRLGFSYRLDPEEGARIFGRFVRSLGKLGLLADRGGPIVAVYFAGLPRACELVKDEHGDAVEVFRGDESATEALDKLAIDPAVRPAELVQQIAYDDARASFARQLVASGKHEQIRGADHAGYAEHGARQDSVVKRLRYAARTGSLPLMRAHVGPYLPDRLAAVQLFLEWAGQLAHSELLDVLSIGTSQLSQSHFGDDWDDLANGGGVPINSPQEYRAVWDASRPMLVRTYAGTRNIPWLARMYEETINIAWHALSFWWFCQIDGRGPYTVYENLEQHLETLRFVAQSGKPFEPNIPHHFAFRGADDVTYVVSAIIAARTAKGLGVRHLILQNMLNTPKGTWGVQDLAKSRALLIMARALEDENFHVVLQPRAGLDYFPPDLVKAREQLAAVTALMDDIEPADANSPPIIHVVSYSEASHIADPPVIDESIQITRAALDEYRRLRARGDVDDMSRHPDVLRRTEELVSGARDVLAAIESAIPEPYTVAGLYRILADGYLPLPYLWEGRDEFRQAVAWRTRLVRGSVKVVDESGNEIDPGLRARAIADGSGQAPRG